jgi:hypothetical protein
MKNITICASASFSKEIQEWKRKLEQQGYKVLE